MLAFAREYKDDAVIVAVGSRWADKTNGGRVWPRGALNAELDLERYSIVGHRVEIRDHKYSVNQLFADLPVAFLIAKMREPVQGTVIPARETAV